jgi:hypothetical protein
MTVAYGTSCAPLSPQTEPEASNMEISKDFLQDEIYILEDEIQKANVFIIKARGTIEAYEMLIRRIEAPEPNSEEQDG